MPSEATGLSGAIPRKARASRPVGRARPWGILRHLSSAARYLDDFLEQRPFERANWLVVGFGAGIAFWLALPGPMHWLALIFSCGAVTLGGLAVGHGARRTNESDLAWLGAAITGIALMVAAGCITVWSKSELAGARGIDAPAVVWLTGRIEARQEQPAQDRVRLTLLARPDGVANPIRVRINLKARDDSPGNLTEGALVRLRARLMPPAPPMVPGGYDFARAAWFSGLSATGSVLGPVQILKPAAGEGSLPRWRAVLSAHVRAQLAGTPGAIASAFASGDRGSIAAVDEKAMRDSGLSHLLSISGLHVSAVVGAGYVLAIRLLALWPWLALRVRLPLVAAAAGAMAGIGYTLLTGAEVPTVRSCIGAVLVLAALALGRDPLSMRMVATGALFVLLFWPEALFGPSFQMSFGAVIAIVALQGAPALRRFLQARDEALPIRLIRQMAVLLLTGIVIELALMPIGLFHFHRAGIYGALANVLAIPLTTFITMPLIALALVLDLAGLGTPAWWGVGKSLELLIWLAHTTAAQPGAVTLLPAMSSGTFCLFVAGGLWLALWEGRVRWWGLVPVLGGSLALLTLHSPDILVSADGRYVAVTTGEERIYFLREGHGDYASSNLMEIAGRHGEGLSIAQLPGASCNRDFCSFVVRARGKAAAVLAAKGRDRVDERALAAACERADIVIADRRLPRSCRPRWLKADRQLLSRTGGIAVNIANRTISTVAEQQGQHGWYRQGNRERGMPARTSQQRPVSKPTEGMPIVERQ